MIKWLTHDMRINPSGFDQRAYKGANRTRGVRCRYLFEKGYNTAEIAYELDLTEAEVIRRLELNKITGGRR